MRLWHKDLIDVLPRQQLLSQWRECCCIARNIAVNGTPNHILVNPILDYPIEHFYLYASIIGEEMEHRGYKCDFSKFTRWIQIDKCNVKYKDLFSGWHNDRYLSQCVYNLQEKYDRGGISYSEWMYVEHRFYGFTTA